MMDIHCCPSLPHIKKEDYVTVSAGESGFFCSLHVINDMKCYMHMPVCAPITTCLQYHQKSSYWFDTDTDTYIRIGAALIQMLIHWSKIHIFICRKTVVYMLET